MIENKNIFITGGAGFIGSTLAQKLANANNIVLFDNLERNTIQHTKLEDNNITLKEGDILDLEALSESMSGCDVVIHAAAIAGIDTVIKNPVKTMEVNMLGTANVLKAALHNKVSCRVVEFSTSEVFGSYAFKAKEEDNTISGSAGEARWTYAVSKLAGEHLSHAYFKQYALPTVSVRPFNVYGPGQTGEGAIQLFIRKALKDEPIYIYGDGSQIRAWCYIDDMIRALMEILNNDNSIGQSFNIGNQRAVTTIYGLAEVVCRILGSKSKIEFKAPLSADIELRIPDTQKAADILNFKALVDLEEGISKTAEWYEKNII